MSTIELIPDTETGRNYVIFPQSPFKLADLSMSIVPTAKSTSALTLGVSSPLVMGVDWFPAFLYNQATAELGVVVYGGVSFVDPLLAGTITYSVTSVGAQYAATPLQISAVLSDASIDPQNVWWESVALDAPTFPRTDPEYATYPLASVDQLSDTLNQLSAPAGAGVTSKTLIDFSAHITASNPHGDNAQTVGLAKTPNWGTGTAASVLAGGSKQEFATPLSVKDSVATLLPAATQDQAGAVALNNGTAAGDSTNATDGLTAAGLLHLLQNDQIESGVSIVDASRQKVSITPFPIPWPVQWQGQIYSTFEDLVAAVEQVTSMSALTADAAQGCIWFPRNFNVPNLAVTPQGQELVIP